MNTTDPYDPWLIHSTSNAVHQDHLLFYWIPFDGATGITEARQLGFDAVMVQPNVAFEWAVNPQNRLQSVANIAQFYGEGLEMELSPYITNSNQTLVQIALNKWGDYFTAGHLYGFEGNVTKAYYLNSQSLLDSYNSTNATIHAAYTDTGQFINGTWTHSTFY